MGGLVALGSCGPERVFYGAPRDRLLGLRFIDSQGHIVSNGGNVVKNVAGYEITRLMTGSAGTLGFITEVTLRTSLLPELCGAVVAVGPLEMCRDVSIEVNKSTLQPVFTVSIPDDPAAVAVENQNWKLFIGFEGFSKTVDYQLEKATALVKKHGLKSIEQVYYSPVEGLFSGYFKNFDQSSFIFRGDFPLNRLLILKKILLNELKIATISVDFGCGRIFAGFDDMNPMIWQELGDLSMEHQGVAILEKAPDDFKEKYDVFGPYRPEWKMVHKIKTALDPHNRFATGPLPGKIQGLDGHY
jgi:FAD/FMN-containing dehydrogenase